MVVSVKPDPCFLKPCIASATGSHAVDEDFAIFIDQYIAGCDANNVAKALRHIRVAHVRGVLVR